MRNLTPLLACLALSGPATGAVYMVSELTFAVTGTTTANGSQTLSFDLSSDPDLVPGLPVRLTFEPDPALAFNRYYFNGSFVFGAGDLDFAFEGSATIGAGLHSDSVVTQWSEQFPNLPGPGTTVANGILDAPTPTIPLVLELPSGTDLSNVSLVITSQSEITGAQASFGNGQFVVPQSVLTVESFVPEPSVSALGGLALLWLFRRRR